MKMFNEVVVSATHVSPSSSGLVACRLRLGRLRFFGRFLFWGNRGKFLNVAGLARCLHFSTGLIHVLAA